MMFSPAYFTPLPLYGSGGRKPRILAATSPTRCLSAPVTTTSVWVGVQIVIPSGVLNSTGCEKPSDRFRSLPCIADRKTVVSGKSVSVRVDLGGRRIIHKKITHNNYQNLRVTSTK